MYLKKKIIITIWCLVVLTSCVPTEPVVLSTNPIGATIYVNGNEYGTTPKEMNLSLDKNHLITIVMEGYIQETIEIKRIFKKEKETKNMINSGINSAKMINSNPLDIANAVVNSSGTDNPNNFTFEQNTLTITLKEK